jgi:hypothetical protein
MGKERMVRVRFDKHNVILRNAKTGEIVKGFSQERKPKESKVIADYIRHTKGYCPVEIEIEVTTEYREMPISVFITHSTIAD